jgi:hypothetical protein
MTALTPWRWVGRALLVGALHVCVAALVGGLLGLWHPMAGGIVVALGVLLVGAPVTIEPLGGAALGAGLIALIAGLGASIEAHHLLVVQRAVVVRLDSLAAWSPTSDVVAVEVPEVTPAPRFTASLTRTTGSGKSYRRVSQHATPLLDAAGRVVGFTCGEQTNRAGTVALSLAAWNGSPGELCDEVISRALTQLSAERVPVEPGARERVVRVFASEAELRAAHGFRLAVVMPLVFFGVYAVFVVLFRSAGVRSANG